MNIKIVNTALQDALSLLHNEIDAIEYEELKNEYLYVIEKIKLALNETAQE